MTTVLDLALIAAVNTGMVGAVAGVTVPAYRTHRAARKQRKGGELKADIERLEIELGMREAPVETTPRWDDGELRARERTAGSQLEATLRRVEVRDAARRDTMRAMGWRRVARPGEVRDATGKPRIYRLVNGWWYLALHGEDQPEMTWGTTPSGTDAVSCQLAFETRQAAAEHLKDMYGTGWVPYGYRIERL